MEAWTDPVEMQSILTSMLENTPDTIIGDKTLEEMNENGLSASNNSYRKKKDSRDAHSENSKLQVEMEVLTMKANSGSIAQIQENESKQNSRKTSGKKVAQFKSDESVSSSNSEEVLQTRFSISNENAFFEGEYSENSNSLLPTEKSDNKCAEYDTKIDTTFSVNNKTELCEKYTNNNSPILPAGILDNEYTSEYNSKLNDTFSINKKNTSDEKELKNNINSISTEKNFDKSNTTSNDSKNINTPPIIIQAIACEEISTNKNDKLNSEMKQPKIINDVTKSKIDLASFDSLSVDISNSITEVKNSTPKVDDQFDYSKKDSWENGDKDDALEALMEKISGISGGDSINVKYPNSRTEISSESIVEDFLNGSLDLSLYSNKEFSNNIKKSEASSMKYEKYEPASSCNVRNSFNMSHLDIPNKTLKRKQSGKRSAKSTKNARTTPKKIKTKNMNIASESPMEVDLKLNSELENISRNTRQAKKPNQLFNTDENIIISNKIKKQNKAANSRRKVSSTPKKKNTKDDKVLNSLLNLNSPKQRPRRNRRNSSLVASQKIKKIEELENSKSVIETCSDSGDETPITPTVSMLESRKTDKKRYQTENINRDGINYENMTTQEDKKLQFHSSSEYKTENVRFSRNNTRNKNAFRSSFDKYSTHDNSSLKWKSNKKEEQITSKYLTSDLYNESFMQEDEELHKKLHTNKSDHSSKNSLKSMKNTKIPGKQQQLLSMNKDLVSKIEQRNEVPSVDIYKGPITRNRRRTWDTLEKELFGESEKEKSLLHDVDKTEILQMSKSVKNQNLQENDEFTLSNTMMQTVGRNTEVNKYNMQYQISAENKYLRSEPKFYAYSNEFNNAQSKEIVPNYCKSTNIIEKSIAAMEKCTSQFLIPKANNNEDEESAAQFEDVSDYDSHEALFHSNITFMRKENKQYYKNEIVSYMKKSIRIDQGIHSNNTEREDSNDDEHLNESSFVVKSFSFKNLVEEKIKETSQEVVPLSQEKYDNPWNKLMKELNVGNENSWLKETSNKEENSMEVIYKPLSQRNKSNKLDKQQKRKQKIINLEDEVNEEDEKSNSDDEQENKVMGNKETEVMVDHALGCENFDSSSFTADADTRGHDQKKLSKSEDASIMKILEKPMKKLESYQRVTKKQIRKSSPKFKLQITKSGSLKLKKHSSKSSSATNSSVEYTFMKQNNRPVAMENEAQEKYKRYLMKLFGKEDTIFKSMADDHNKTKCIKAKSKENENSVDKNGNQRMENIKLIAEKDDDVFSLSSSDSEPCNKDKQGSGDLCDLFDD